jgi:hypothetical protein
MATDNHQDVAETSTVNLEAHAEAKAKTNAEARAKTNADAKATEADNDNWKNMSPTTQDYARLWGLSTPQQFSSPIALFSSPLFNSFGRTLDNISSSDGSFASPDTTRCILSMCGISPPSSPSK